MRVPAIMKCLSGVLTRPLPTKGLRMSEDTLRLPIRTPISTSVDPNLER